METAKAGVRLRGKEVRRGKIKIKYRGTEKEIGRDGGREGGRGSERGRGVRVSVSELVVE